VTDFYQTPSGDPQDLLLTDAPVSTSPIFMTIDVIRNPGKCFQEMIQHNTDYVLPLHNYPLKADTSRSFFARFRCFFVNFPNVPS
jgi:hypothetical protein